MTPHVVVVGAGLGGLSAALELVSRGLSVTVVEADDGPGGKAGTASYQGVTFDTGPSVLTLAEVFDRAFQSAGTSLQQEVKLIQPNSGFRYRYPDGVVLDVHHEPSRTVQNVRSTLGESAAQELESFLQYAKQIWDAASPHFVFGQAPSVRTLVQLGATNLGALWKIDSLRSMQSAIDARVRSSHLRMLLKRYATYNGSDPRKAPATLNCIAHVELGRGWYGVQGGIGAVVHALARVAQRSGATFRYGARVQQLITIHGRVAGVRLQNGEELSATAVVANADPMHVASALTPPAQRRGMSLPDDRSMSGYTFVVAARRRLDRPAHQVLFPGHYDEEFRDIFDRDRPPHDPTLYLCAQEKAHERHGWKEHEPLFVMANAPAEPAGGSRDARQWQALAQRMHTRLVEAKLIDPDDRVVWERSPTDLARQFPGSRGAIYGGSSNGMTAAFQRPANRVAKLPGLYLASGGAHPGGGMPLCLQSGRAAAEALVEDLGSDARSSEVA